MLQLGSLLRKPFQLVKVPLLQHLQRFIQLIDALGNLAHMQLNLAERRTSKQLANGAHIRRSEDCD